MELREDCGCVCSSGGGGGGTKGPSVIDKRNQEEQCPHCERIFKQASGSAIRPAYPRREFLLRGRAGAE